MKLHEYFAQARGIGVLGTADAAGQVNLAVYSRPHFLGGADQQLAFIMRDRLSHDNLQSNPQAAYLFVEEGPDYNGVRLLLRRTEEETDPEKIRTIRRREVPAACLAGEDETMFLVSFRVEGVRPLIGDGEPVVSLAVDDRTARCKRWENSAGKSD